MDNNESQCIHAARGAKMKRCILYVSMQLPCNCCCLIL